MSSRFTHILAALSFGILGLFSACGPEPTSVQPPSQPKVQENPKPEIRDSGAGLEITNTSGQILTIRVAFVIPIEGGNVGVCNPYGDPNNRGIPLPEDPSSPYDQMLPPTQTLRVPSGPCPNYVGYSVWARNANGELIFEKHK